MQTDANVHYLHGVPAKPGGTSGGDGMEARIARLESAVEYIHRDVADIKTDVREIRGKMDTHFYWILGAFAGLLAVLARGFHWI